MLNISLLIYPLSLFLLIGCSTSKQLEEENARQMLSEQMSPDTTQPSAQADSLYEIRAGDEVEILVWEQPNFNTSTTVSNQGTITVPLVGDMNVTGLTQDELERDLTRELSQYIKDDVNLTVSIRNTDNLAVSVFGMVGDPDNYPIVDETSIFRVLSMAGGPEEEADIRNIKIYRNGGSSNYEQLDLTRYLESGQMNSASMVYPGDIIYVPGKENAVREMSDFLRDVVMLFGIFRVVN